MFLVQFKILVFNKIDLSSGQSDGQTVIRSLTKADSA